MALEFSDEGLQRTCELFDKYSLKPPKGLAALRAAKAALAEEVGEDLARVFLDVITLRPQISPRPSRSP